MKPMILMVGADKGGVGKTTVSRTVAEYLAAKGFAFRAIDTETPQGVFKRFVVRAEVVDMTHIEGQMSVLDRIDGITLIDVKAGMLSQLVRLLDEARLLDDVKAGKVRLVLMHVLGPTRQSLGEVPAMRDAIGGGSVHFLVKNFISETQGYFGWTSAPDLAGVLAALAPTTISVPHLEDRAAEEIDVNNDLFGVYSQMGESRTLRGKTGKWLDRVWAEFDRIGLDKLAAEAVA